MHRSTLVYQYLALGFRCPDCDFSWTLTVATEWSNCQLNVYHKLHCLYSNQFWLALCEVCYDLRTKVHIIGSTNMKNQRHRQARHVWWTEWMLCRNVMECSIWVKHNCPQLIQEGANYSHCFNDLSDIIIMGRTYAPLPINVEKVVMLVWDCFCIDSERVTSDEQSKCFISARSWSQLV